MTLEDITKLTLNGLFLFLLLIIYTFIKKRVFPKATLCLRYNSTYQLVNGLCLSLIAIPIMSYSVTLVKYNTFMFDSRFLLLATIAFLFHIRTTMVCLITICLLRLYFGGNFETTGATFSIGFLIALIGFYWHPHYKTTTRVHFQDLLFYAFITQAVHLIFLFFVVPFAIIQHTLITFLLTYPLLSATIIYYLNTHGERPVRLFESIEDSYLFNVQYNSKSVGFAISTPQKKLIKFNAAFYELLGYSKDDFKEITWSDYTHPDDQQVSLDLFNQLLSGQIEEYNLKKRFIRKDGQVIYVQLNVYGIRNESNKIEFVVSTYIDLHNKATRFADAQAYNKQR